MIVLNHHTNQVKSKTNKVVEEFSLQSENTLDQLFMLAQRYPMEWIGWTNHENTYWEELQNKASHRFTILSSGKAPGFIANGIDYVEDSPFINYIHDQWYPTWIMSSDQGMIHASVLNLIRTFPSTSNFEYDLNLLTRHIQSQGIFCYSKLENNYTKSSRELAYKFVAQSVKKSWIFFLLIAHISYERSWPFVAFIKAVFKQRITSRFNFSTIQQVEDSTLKPYHYDVIIPTMGRSKYLRDVLKDLSVQTILPTCVYIVEQNEDINSTTELTYLKEEEWPYKIQHYFFHQTGACNARNVALTKTTEEWVLLFDDDARLDSDIIEQMIQSAINLNVKCINASYLQKGEKESKDTFTQWPYFGSGCSIVHRDIVDSCEFDMALEHGYGEDVDYGMQIRSAGYDVIYAPQIQILHLKAPVGGFRNPITFPWSEDVIQPKPSPQIMYFRSKNHTVNQLLGYKLVLLIKYYNSQPIKNPFKYYKWFKKAWNSSLKWSQRLG